MKKINQRALNLMRKIKGWKTLPTLELARKTGLTLEAVDQTRQEILEKE